MEKVAVLLPVYAGDKTEWFDLALNSVLNQEVCDSYVFVGVDGPLGEGLNGVLDNYRNDEHVRIYRYACNRGMTAVLNDLLEEVIKGDYGYIARMDADDISMPNRFALQVDYLRNHPDVAVVGGSIREFNATNDCVNIRHYPETNEEVIDYICRASPCAHPAVMMRRSIFESGISYNGKYRTSQDLALWYDIVCAGFKINNMRDVVLKFRMADDLFNRRSRAYARNEFKIYCNGIYRLYGFFSWRYVYPLFRYLFRLMPVKTIQRIYNSNIRQKILQKKFV